ncbi:MAG TPA: hypothetical protein GXZ90_04830 [Clostridiales bacterium]|nr:hypothetical protein [Clostridiales bacterium]
MNKLNKIQTCLNELNNINKEEKYVESISFNELKNSKLLHMARKTQLMSRTNEIIKELRIIMELPDNTNVGQIFTTIQEYLSKNESEANHHNETTNEFTKN